MTLNTSASTVNMQLVDSLVQAIQSLSSREQAVLLDKLLGNTPYPSTQELIHLADEGGSFEFWQKEPDLYTVEDGEPVTWS